MNHDAKMRAAQSLRMYPGDTDYQVKQDGPAGEEPERKQRKVAAFGVCVESNFHSLRTGHALPSTIYGLSVVDDPLDDLLDGRIAVAVMPIEELTMLAESIHNAACDVVDEHGSSTATDRLFDLADCVRACMTPEDS